MKKFTTIFAALATASVLLSQSALTSEEQRGRQIYERGTTTSGRSITATMGADNEGIPGSLLPCANCHGHDGRGKPESGTFPSDITWDTLIKPYGVAHANGRTHPPYTERLVKRAVTLGVDPVGNSLDTAMPRFAFYNEDFADLVAYIKKLGQTSDPGLTSDTIRLGVILPRSEQYSSISPRLRGALLQYFARVNGMGGIFSRRVELSFTEMRPHSPDAAATLGAFIRDEKIFALVGGFFNDAEREIAGVLDETGTPSVAAFAATPYMGSPLNRYAFYLDGGTQAEVNALIQVAVLEFPDKKAKVAIEGDENSRRMAQSLKEGLEKAGFDFVPGAGADVIFWLRPESAAQGAVFSPRARVYMAAANGLPSEDLQWWELRAIAAAELISEGLKRAGRGVTREALIEALEGIYHFETKAGPMSFGPNRRIGSPGADVFLMDPKMHRFVRLAI